MNFLDQMIEERNKLLEEDFVKRTILTQLLAAAFSNFKQPDYLPKSFTLNKIHKAWGTMTIRKYLNEIGIVVEKIRWEGEDSLTTNCYKVFLN